MTLLVLVVLALVLGWEYSAGDVAEAGIFGWLIGLIGTLFIDIGRIVWDVVRAIRPIFEAVLNGIRFVIDRIGQNAGRFFRAIASGVRTLYNVVISPVVDAVRIGFDRFRGFLDRVFSPIFRVLDWVSDFLDKIWSRVIAPIFEVLDRLRLVFRLLDELGVGFAGLVERFLERIQTEIFNAFREVRTFVNNVTSWFDVLLDPRGWIRSTPFLMTIWRYGGNVFNLLLALDPTQERTATRVADFKQRNLPKPLAASVSRFRDGTVRGQPALQQTVARFKSRRTGQL